MSLLGLRDLSVIETPPKDRFSVQTVVARSSRNCRNRRSSWSWPAAARSISSITASDSIWNAPARYRQRFPRQNRRRARANGRGRARKSDARLHASRFDILVCTTIIENGLDIPLANTIIIENAERTDYRNCTSCGAVWAAPIAALTPSTGPAETELSEIARKRLAALKEFSDFGADSKSRRSTWNSAAPATCSAGAARSYQCGGVRHVRRLLERDGARVKGGGGACWRSTSDTESRAWTFESPDYIADENQRLRAYRQISRGHAKRATVIEKELADR